MENLCNMMEALVVEEESVTWSLLQLPVWGSQRNLVAVVSEGGDKRVWGDEDGEDAEEPHLKDGEDVEDADGLEGSMQQFFTAMQQRQHQQINRNIQATAPLQPEPPVVWRRLRRNSDGDDLGAGQGRRPDSGGESVVVAS
ncbi:hypothetical protein QJS10_CPA09g00882 [Acorus calamus]|uniref:Uncharacterized protein n=1 Tax=Acorus calamus TaxID=4465 RepID=A0AAV9E9G1_ACOCL|nr:hypothetical protein QJS10_CPA09g00882 [Acorus calamus]